MRTTLIVGLVCAVAGVGSVVAISVYHPWQARTVDWFVEHPAEMMTKISACRNNPGVGRNDPECINSEEAKWKADLRASIAANPYK
jgi:hypothetical protein